MRARKTLAQCSGLEDIIERMAEYKKAKERAEQKKLKEQAALNDKKGGNKDAEKKRSETDMKHDADHHSDEEAEKKVLLRDREFTKEELTHLEKKTWIELKDMIFETDPSILDYLTYHCKRWRMTKKNGLSEDFNKLKNASGSARGYINGAKGAANHSQGSSAYNNNQGVTSAMSNT